MQPTDEFEGPSLCTLMREAVELARTAGRRILEVYDSDYTVQHKEDDTPLTEADMAAHQAIIAGLAILTPEIPVLSEESGEVPYDERRRWRRYWLVDPLDGTREFIKHNGQFSINIALIDDHRPLLGVVLMPVGGVCYHACRGHGAWKWRIEEEEPVQIRVRQSPPERVVVAAGSGSHSSRTLQRFLTKLGEHEVIRVGSSIKSCLVAEGKADLYARLGPTSEWDTAAAQCIVEEAGGHVTDTSMQPLRYNTKDSLLNPHFFIYGDSDRDWSRYL